MIDYSGFTPFIGLSLSFNHVKYSEDLYNATYFSLKKQSVSPGIIFGWDILPDETRSPLVLRTNLRWFPLENSTVTGEHFSLNQLEYNIIQAVFYPSRIKKVIKENTQKWFRKFVGIVPLKFH